MSESPPLTARAEKVSVDAGRGGGGKGPGWGRGCVEEAGGRTAGGGSIFTWNTMDCSESCPLTTHMPIKGQLLGEDERVGNANEQR